MTMLRITHDQSVMAEILLKLQDSLQQNCSTTSFSTEHHERCNAKECYMSIAVIVASRGRLSITANKELHSIATCRLISPEPNWL